MVGYGPVWFGRAWLGKAPARLGPVRLGGHWQGAIWSGVARSWSDKASRVGGQVRRGLVRFGLGRRVAVGYGKAIQL